MNVEDASLGFSSELDLKVSLVTACRGDPNPVLARCKEILSLVRGKEKRLGVRRSDSIGLVLKL